MTVLTKRGDGRNNFQSITAHPTTIQTAAFDTKPCDADVAA